MSVYARHTGLRTPSITDDRYFSLGLLVYVANKGSACNFFLLLRYVRKTILNIIKSLWRRTVCEANHWHKLEHNIAVPSSAYLEVHLRSYVMPNV